MDVIGVVIGAIFWPVAFVRWIKYVRGRRPAKWVAIAGTAVVVGLPTVGAIAFAKAVLIDEDLVSAAGGGDAAKVRWLLGHWADPNSDVKGFSAIGLASFNGHAQIVRMLLDNGASPNGMRWFHKTPLREAQEGGHPDIVRLLRSAGATK